MPTFRQVDPWWQRALDILLPPRCVGWVCAAWRCAACVAGMKVLGPRVRGAAGRRSADGCVGAVRGARVPLRAVIAAHPFEGVPRAAVLGFEVRRADAARAIPRRAAG